MIKIGRVFHEFQRRIVPVDATCLLFIVEQGQTLQIVTVGHLREDIGRSDNLADQLDFMAMKFESGGIAVQVGVIDNCRAISLGYPPRAPCGLRIV